MNCLRFQLYYLIRHGGIGFNICSGEGLCLCHGIFTRAVEVKISSLSSALFIRLDFRATTTGNCSNWHQSINYRKALLVARFEGMCMYVFVIHPDTVCVCACMHACMPVCKLGTVCVWEGYECENKWSWLSFCLCYPFQRAKRVINALFWIWMEVIVRNFSNALCSDTRKPIA